MPRIIGLTIAFFFVLCLPGLAQSLEQVTIQLKWYHQFQFAGYYAAIEQGFYEEQGLDVTLLEGSPEKDTLQVLLRGDADYAVHNHEGLLAYMNGQPTVALGVFFQHSPTVLIYDADSGINEVQDLEGQIIASRTSNIIEIQTMLNQQGLDDTKFDFVQVTSLREALKKIKSGEYAAVAGYTSNEPLLLRKIGVTPGIIHPLNHGINFYGDTLFTTRATALNAPQRTQRVLDATIKGWEYAMAHPQEIISLIISKYSRKKNQEQLQYEAQALYKLMLPHLVPVGSMSNKRWERIADAYVSLGLAPRPKNFSSFIFSSERIAKRQLTNTLRLVSIVVLAISILALLLFLLNKRLKQGLRVREEELRHQRDTMRTLLNVSPIAMLQLRNNAVEWANPSSTSMLGYSEEELLGMGVDALYPSPQEADAVQKSARSSWLGQNTTTLDATMVRKDGTHFVSHASMRHISSTHEDLGYIMAIMDITKHKEMVEALRESEERFKALFQLSPYGVALMDLNPLKYQDMNEAFCKQCGYSQEELHKMTPSDLSIGASNDAVQAWIDRLLSHGHITNEEAQIRHKSGHIIDLLYSCVLLTLNNSLKIIVITNDITARKETQRRIQLSAQVFEQSRDSIVITAPDGTIVDLNQTFTELTGYTAEETLGQTPAILKSGRHGSTFYRNMWKSIEETGSWRGEIWNRKKDGELFPCWLLISAVHDTQGNVVNYVGTFSDLTQEKESAESIYRLNNYDLLTGLPNRALFLNMLEQEKEHTHADGSGLAVFVLDLDDFKGVNESLGIGSGDEVLREAGKRLKQLDYSGAVPARFGSDEFAMLVPDITSAEQAGRVIERMQSLMAEPFQLTQSAVYLTASVGASLYPHDAIAPQQLIRNAENALHHALENGPGNYAFFTPAMTQRASERMTINNALREAVERQEFVLHYQPKIQLSTGKAIGCEALIRWNHPEWGLVPPGRFITQVEESDLIHPIGEWVLEEACMACVRMNAMVKKPLYMAVNLSPKQFHERDVVAIVASTLKKTGLSPHLLELEITEAVLVRDADAVVETMQRLKQLGVSLAIDDFGTGYSSLQYLSRFPLDTLKVDRSFISTMENDSRNAAITSAVVAMASSLGLTVVAEGVENETHAEILRQLGCMTAQGYLYSKPIAEAEFMEFIDTPK